MCDAVRDRFVVMGKIRHREWRARGQRDGWRRLAAAPAAASVG